MEDDTDTSRGLRRWRRIGSHEVYRSPWVGVREDSIVFPNRQEGAYSVFELGRCVGVLPLCDDDRVALVRQYRYIGDAFPWEMPTGAIAAGESPEEAANRELAEEAGYRAGQLEPLGHFRTSKAHCDEVAYLFVGRALTPALATPDETEEIERGFFSFDEVLEMVRDGRIVDSMTIIAMLRVALDR